jgi:uncharacterized membrane protein YdjX (TVP38/TMEM64 family)
VPAGLAPPADGARPASSGRALLRSGIVAVLLVGAGVALRHSGLADLRAMQPTPAGAIALVAAGAVLTAAGLPRQAVAFAGGFVFGVWTGTAVSLLAQMIGCALDYAAAHGLLAAWAMRRLSRGGRLANVHRQLAAHPFTATLTLRLLPVGNNVVVNLLAGVAGVRVVPFMAGTLLGYVPQTVIFALLGSGVQIGRGAQLAAAVGLFVLAAAVGVVLWRKEGQGSALDPLGP